MCVTKINKHSPSFSVSAPKAWLSCLRALLSSLSLSPCPHSLLAPTGNQHPSPTGSHVVPVCSEGQTDINCGSNVYLLSFYLISCSQASGQGANAQIAWGQSAEWLGQGRSFHTQSHAPKKSPSQRRENRVGCCFYNIRDSRNGF